MARTKKHERERKDWLARLKTKKTKMERYPTGVPAMRKPKTEEHKKAISEGVKKVMKKGIEVRNSRKEARRKARHAALVARAERLGMIRHRPASVISKITATVKKTLQDKRELAAKGGDNNGLDNKPASMDK